MADYHITSEFRGTLPAALIRAVSPNEMMMDEKDLEILKLLFVEHQRQLTEKRHKIHATSEKTLALLMLIAGWLVLTKEPLVRGIHWVIIGAVIIIAVAACKSIYRNNKSYYIIARLIRRINDSLGLYEEGRFASDEPLYPAEWKHFGEQKEIQGALFHILAISAGAALCVVAAFLRA